MTQDAGGEMDSGPVADASTEVDASRAADAQYYGVSELASAALSRR